MDLTPFASRCGFSKNISIRFTRRRCKKDCKAKYSIDISPNDRFVNTAKKQRGTIKNDGSKRKRRRSHSGRYYKIAQFR